jgi:dTDP-6-deoxy-L-talose 4-dehydrogenase (NAD+)
MKVLVTGSTSFIGRYIVDALLADKHDVVASGRSIRCPKFFENDVIWRSFDLSEPTDNPFIFFEKPDLLIHAAWNGLPNYTSELHIKQIPWHTNFINSLIGDGLSHFLGIGTCLEYGMNYGCLNETMKPLSPIAPYGAGKNSVREIVSRTCQKNGVDFHWLRLFYVVGDGLHRNSLISQLNRALSGGDKVFRMSKGDQVRDFIDVENAARLIIRIAMQKNIFGIINCCSGVPISVLDFVKDIITRQRMTIKLELEAYPIPTYEPTKYWGDITKLELALQNKSSHQP